MLHRNDFFLESLQILLTHTKIQIQIKVSFCQKVLMFLSYLQKDEHFTFLNLKICKALSFQTYRHPQFLSNFQTPKFKFSVSWKKNVHLFGVMTKTSVPSDKNVLLPPSAIDSDSTLSVLYSKLKFEWQPVFSTFQTFSKKSTYLNKNHFM